MSAYAMLRKFDRLRHGLIELINVMQYTALQNCPQNLRACYSLEEDAHHDAVIHGGNIFARLPEQRH